MKRDVSKYLRLLLGILFIFSSALLFSQQTSKKDSIFNEIQQYYYQCKKIDIKSPALLPMADSLYKMSVAHKFVKMQPIALILKLDHYYAKRNTDSVRFYCEYVKKICKETKQKNHYFFAWRKLIYYYIDEQFYELALKELEDMPKEAMAINYIQGVIESYGMLSQLYMSRGINDKAIENMERAIEMTQEYNINDYNFNYKCVALTTLYIEEGEFDKAEEYLKIGLANAKSVSMKANVYRGYARLYIEKNDPVLTRKNLDLAKEYDNVQKIGDGSLFSLEGSYYMMIGDYKKALEYFDKVSELRQDDSKILKKKAICYHQIGSNDKAFEFLQKALEFQEKIFHDYSHEQVAEHLAALELNSTEAEKMKLEQRLNVISLRYTRIIAFVLLVISIIFVLIALRYFKLNKKLKKSEQVRMTFLNNISHEIRTPLNSIVGFSEIIAEEVRDNKELTKYSNIISNSSQSLLKMISNATEVADIDSMGILMNMDINEVVQFTIDKYRASILPSVSLTFNKCQPKSNFTFYYDKVEKVLNNLIDNAVIYTKEGSIVIDVNYLKDKKMMVFSISNTCEAIPVDKQDEIFALFSKIDDFSKGLGLGLPIGRMMAESIKGSLELDKSFTQGCRFVFMFPVQG